MGQHETAPATPRAEDPGDDPGRAVRRPTGIGAVGSVRPEGFVFSRAPMLVYWETTLSCGLTCRHCRAEAIPARAPDELTTEEGFRLLDAITGFGRPYPHLVFTGGDPLRRSDLEMLVEAATARGIGASLAPAATPELTPGRLRALTAAGIQTMSLSLDGSTAERHDAFRGVPGTFEATLRAAEWTHDIGLPLQVNTLVTDETLADLPAIHELMTRIGIIRWSLFFLISVGRGTALREIDPGQSEKLNHWLYDLSKTSPFAIKTTEATHYRRVAVRRMRAEGLDDAAIATTSVGRGFGVRDGNGIMFVANNGFVFPSGFLPIPTGNLRTDDIVALYREHPVFTSLRNAAAFKGRCGRCEYARICGGSRARAFAWTGDPLEADPLCPSSRRSPRPSATDGGHETERTVTVLIVGGGITGLATAYALGKAGVPTLLVEGSSRLGGKVRTETVDGFVIEHGPDSFISYRPAGLQLCRELGLGDAIIGPEEPRTVFVRARGRFLRLPERMGLVLPTKLVPFLTSELFSPLEKARMGLDLVLPRDGRTGDIAVGPFLRRRFGRALVDRLAGPLIGGVYGTPIDELSLDAVVPQLRESERRHRSLLLASLSDARPRARGAGAAGGDTVQGTSAPPFVALAGGTRQLVDALIDAVHSMPSVEVRAGSAADGLDVSAACAAVRLAGGERIRAEAVILAAPAPVTASLLDGVAPEASRHLRSIPHGSTAVVNLAYRDDQVAGDLTGHGFLVAGGEPLGISACTLSSNKWAGRAPVGTLLARAFIGAGRGGVRDASDEALVEVAHRDVADTLGIRGRPVLTRISRYPSAMPQYTVGHLDRVAAAEAALRPFPALRIAGAAYRGAGLPDCIAQGRAAAEAVAALLSNGAAGASRPNDEVRSAASRA